MAGVIDLLRELKLSADFGPSFAPSPVMQQISREADVHICMINDNELTGEPGNPENA